MRPKKVEISYGDVKISFPHELTNEVLGNPNLPAFLERAKQSGLISVVGPGTLHLTQEQKQKRDLIEKKIGEAPNFEHSIAELSPIFFGRVVTGDKSEEASDYTLLAGILREIRETIQKEKGGKWKPFQKEVDGKKRRAHRLVK